jgi:uncharacterized membrane protein
MDSDFVENADRIRRLEERIDQLRRDLEQLRDRFLETFRAEIDRLEANLRANEEDLSRLKGTDRPATFTPVPLPLPSPTPAPQPISRRRPPLAPPPPPPPAQPAPVAPKARPAVQTLVGAVRKEGWEAFFGEKVLSRVGIIVLLFGIVFLIGYQISTGGVWAKLLGGGFTGAGLIGLGIYLGRKVAWRPFIFPIVGGGWAIFFFTVFAAGHIPQVLVVENRLLAFLLLMAVGAGMIGHSLAYRSQGFTAFTALLAYLAIGTVEIIGSAGTSTLYALLVLALSVAALRWRLGWRMLMAGGIAATYMLASIWLVQHLHHVGGVGDPGPLFVSALVPLALYVLVFKATEWLSGKTDAVEAGIQLANSLFGILLFSFALGHVYPRSMYLGFAAAGAVHAAFAWRLRRAATAGVFELGAVVAIALVALSIGHAFVYRPEAMAAGFLIEALAVLAAGLLLRRALFLWLAALLVVGGLIPLDLAPDPSLWTAILFAGAAALATTALRRWARREGQEMPEGLPWQIAGGVALLIVLWREPQQIAIAGLIYSEALLGLGLFLRLRDTRIAAIGAFVGAAAAFGVAASAAAPPFEILVAFIALPLVNTLALARRGAPAIEHVPWHLAAMAAGLIRYDDDLRSLSVTWLIQAEALLALATVVRNKPVRIVSHACFITAGFALMQAAGGGQDGTLLLLLLYAAVGVANSIVVHRIRPEEAVGDAEPLVWHLPVALVPLFLFDSGYLMCMAWLVQSQVVLATSIVVGRNRPLRLAQPAIFAAAAVALTVGSFAHREHMDLFGAVRDESVRYLFLMSVLAYMNARAFDRRELHRYGGAAALAALIWNAFDPSVSSMLWGAAAIVLWELGSTRRDPHYRLQGNLLIAAAAAYLPIVNFGSELFLRGAAYALVAGAAWRLYARQHAADGATPLDRVLRSWNPALSWMASGLAGWYLFLQVDRPELTAALALLAAALLAAGMLLDRPPLRQQALAAASFSFLEGMMSGLASRDLPTWIWMAASASPLLVMGILADRRSGGRFERPLPWVYSFAGTILLGFLFWNAFERHWVTIAWGAEGLALVVSGLLLRQRVLRYPGLAMLIWCMGKIVVDLWRLELAYRIPAFIALGLLLLATSFAYARFRHLFAPKEST